MLSDAGNRVGHHAYAPIATTIKLLVIAWALLINEWL
jgi:hypothetical protein